MHAAPSPVSAPAASGSSPDHPSPAPPAGNLPGPTEACVRISSHSLLGTQRQVEIVHGDAVYRLRLTALGKLILTK